VPRLSRRSFAFVAVFGVVSALGLFGPFPQPLSAPPPTPASEASATPPAALSTTSPGPAVALDLAVAEEAERVAAALEAGGYSVAEEAPVRVADAAHPEAERYVVTAWALVVHPRAPVLDLTAAEADALLGARGGSWAALLGEDAADEGDVTLHVQDAALSWLAEAHPLPGRALEAATVEEVMAAVAADPAAVGLLDATLLDPRVRALTVGGWDPYRDGAQDAPLAQARWINAPTQDEADALAHVLGWRGVEAPPSAGSEGPVGFLATGEMIPARCTQALLSDHEDGFDAMFAGTRGLVGAADLAMAHWEPSVVDAEATPCTATFNMSTLPAAAEATARAGVDVALAIGNHMGDCWSGCAYPDAVLETVGHLEAAGLLVAGAGADLKAARQPVLTTVEGVTFAFLGYDEIASEFYGATEETAGTAPLREETLAEDVRAAKARADHVVVGFSWGVEYVADPTDRQREAARIAVEAGASLVVGNHPHWVQATEWLPTNRGGAFVAYSLGNFIFDQDWSVETTQGAVLEVGFTRDRILGVRLRPTSILERHLVEWVRPASTEGRAILGRMWDATDALPPRATDASGDSDESVEAAP